METWRAKGAVKKKKPQRCGKKPKGTKSSFFESEVVKVKPLVCS